MLSIWGVILQWGSTIKVSIELPIAARHYCDMTEKLLEAMLNQNNQPTKSLNKIGCHGNQKANFAKNIQKSTTLKLQGG